MSSRARSIATASRLPPPMDPDVVVEVTTILAPAVRGAWPRTEASVTSTPGSRRARNRVTASSQAVSATGRLQYPFEDALGPRGIQRPVHGLGRGRRREVDADAGRPERGR